VFRKIMTGDPPPAVACTGCGQEALPEPSTDQHAVGNVPADVSRGEEVAAACSLAAHGAESQDGDP
jgi:hypothetical protein